VHELGTDGGAVVAASLCGVGTVFEVVRDRGGKGLGREELAERIERCLEVTPAAKYVER
jgi:hypothetical protein